MKLHNFLPVFLECMKRWESRPSYDEFIAGYYEPMRPWLDILFADFGARLGTDFYGVLADVEWDEYRTHVLRMDPLFEENRVRETLKKVQALFAAELEGDIVLFSSFQCMDGYARFHQGKHCVFLGVDESHGPSKYLDVLIAHELTHVVRESRASTWEGFGLSLSMTHDEFVVSQPVIEHLMGEGLSCVVSEILVPGEHPWNYCYQSAESLNRIDQNSHLVDLRVVHELTVRGSSYRNLYNVSSYGDPQMPIFCHYVWAWQWVKHLLSEHHGDVRGLVNVCSKDLIDHALRFQLKLKLSA